MTLDKLISAAIKRDRKLWVVHLELHGFDCLADDMRRYYGEAFRQAMPRTLLYDIGNYIDDHDWKGEAEAFACDNSPVELSEVWDRR